MKLLKSFKKLDLFKTAPQFTINGSESLGSYLGGLISLIYLIVSLIYAGYVLEGISQKYNYSVLSSTSTNKSQILNLNKDNLSFYVKVTNVPLEVDINKLFQLQMFQMSYFNTPN
jgi:hypothetical protein